MNRNILYLKYKDKNRPCLVNHPATIVRNLTLPIDTLQIWGYDPVDITDCWRWGKDRSVGQVLLRVRITRVCLLCMCICIMYLYIYIYIYVDRTSQRSSRIHEWVQTSSSKNACKHHTRILNYTESIDTFDDADVQPIAEFLCYSMEASEGNIE